MERTLAIKKIIAACVIFLTIPLALISQLFDPIFRKMDYGAYVTLYGNFLEAAILGVFIVIIFFLIMFFLKINIFASSEEAKKDLSIKRLIILTVVVTCNILILSAFLDFQFKPFYDLGEHYTGLQLKEELSFILICALKLLLVFMIIKLSQEGFETLIKTKYAIPFGGIFATISFSLYDVLMGYQPLWYIYIFMGLIFGALYILTNRNFKNTYILMLLVYIF